LALKDEVTLGEMSARINEPPKNFASKVEENEDVEI
jgi:hypothetical protein